MPRRFPHLRGDSRLYPFAARTALRRRQKHRAWALRILRDEDAVGAAVAIESAETAAWLPQATQNNSSAATITAHKKRFNGAKPPFCIK